MPTRRKIYVNDDNKDKLLPKFLYNALKTHSTSLGDNNAFPVIGDVPFDYKIIKDSYAVIVEKAKSLGIFGKNVDELESTLSRLVNDCKRQEDPIRDFLTKECENMINSTFSIPKEALIIEYTLQDEVKPNSPMRIHQEDMGAFRFEDAEDAEEFVKEVDKRRIVDSLIQGAASEFSNMMLEEFGSEGQVYALKDKYYKINAINEYLLYVKKEEISEKNPMQGGYVEVHLGTGGEKTTIKVQGIIFPFLLREAVRGLFEVFSSHGLPENKRRAQAIIRRADFILAEPWDMRFGGMLYSKIFSLVEKREIIPYMFMNLVSLDTENFNKFMKDVLSDSNSGEKAVNWLYSVSSEDMYDDSSLEKEPSDGDSRGVINDDSYGDEQVVSEELLKESQESKSISAAKQMMMKTYGYDEKQADDFVRIKLRSDLPVLRTQQGGKFILGVTRMYCNGELYDASTISSLNATLKLVSSDAHINEYDRNLNGMSCKDLISKFSKAMNSDMEATKNEISSMSLTPNDYKIVRIDSFEDAKEYGNYVSWCVTHDWEMFDSYTSDGINQFYFCLKPGFENVPKQEGENTPLDEYGLSMIAVSVNENGGLNTCTCRWNHSNGGDDAIMNEKEVSSVIGMNFYDVFKPNNKFKELIASVKERLKNGETPDDIFGKCFYHEGLTRVGIGGKYNFIDEKGNFISNQWFDDAYSLFNEGFVPVGINDKWNFINKQGEYLSKRWFDSVSQFNEGFAPVRENGKFNYIDQKGNLLTDRWLDFCNRFINGFGSVKIDDGWNFINKQGNFVSDTLYDLVGQFSEGFAGVRKNKQWNFINQRGEVLCDRWYDDVKQFVNGFAPVGVKYKWNFIDKNGEIICDNWFNEVSEFRDGFAKVGYNGKYNFINQEGRFLTQRFFDDAYDFNEGLATVKIQEKWNFINKQGGFLSKRWFDDIYAFSDGWGLVDIRGKYNFINNQGKFLSKTWFDYAEDFYQGVAQVELDGGTYEIDTRGILHALDESYLSPDDLDRMVLTEEDEKMI